MRVTLDPKLNFNLNVNTTVLKDEGARGFAKRWSKEFTDQYVNEILFTKLVRPILEYGPVVCDKLPFKKKDC